MKEQLDIIERKIIASIFGQDFENSSLFKFIMTFYGDAFDKKVKEFESKVSKFLNSDGSVKNELVNSMLVSKFGDKFKDFVSGKTMASEIVDILINFVK